MNRKFLHFISLIMLIFLPASITYAQPEAPAYAKWGLLAVKTTKEKYPKAKIVDYLHLGREDKANFSIEKFKLWIIDEGEEFGLFINIEFDPKNDRVKRIVVKKSAT